MQKLPDKKTLKTIVNLLRKDDYGMIQFIPFKEHSDVLKENELPRLIEAEKNISGQIDRKEPVIYEYTFSRNYYCRMFKINRKQELLAALFLYSKTLTVKEIEDELSEYYDLICDFLEKAEGDTVRFQFKLIPAFNFIILADCLDSAMPDRVFFYRDSLHLGSYLMRKGNMRGGVADIGTGTGILSLVSISLGASRATAVDINPRAIEFAEINVELNGLENIFLRKGNVDSIIEFDGVNRIVSNPPYMFDDERDKSSCINGGSHFGMETALKIVKLAVEKEVKLIMILASPISSDGNLFENLLSDEAGITRKEMIDLQKLYSEFSHNQPLIKAGFTHREFPIYEIDRTH
ncbi:MAG: methyltransferase [bacterium]